MSKFKTILFYLGGAILGLLFGAAIIAAAEADHKHFVEQHCVVTSESRDEVMFIAMPDGNGGTYMMPQYYTENLVKCDDGKYWN